MVDADLLPVLEGLVTHRACVALLFQQPVKLRLRQAVTLQLVSLTPQGLDSRVDASSVGENALRSPASLAFHRLWSLAGPGGARSHARSASLCEASTCRTDRPCGDGSWNTACRLTACVRIG